MTYDSFLYLYNCIEILLLIGIITLKLEGKKMRLDDYRESDYVDDRRGSSGYSRGGGMSMGTMMMLWPLVRPLLRTKFGWAIIGLGVAAYFGGFNPLSLLGGGASSHKVDTKKDNKSAIFMKKVLATTEDVWSQLLPKYGMRYKKPQLVMYSGSTHSGCGGAQAQMGPFYCPMDKKVYLDLSFLRELSTKFGVQGDFAQAYVIAHEIGHHIQDLQGTLSKVQKLKQRWGGGAKSNALQVRVELQADCYAGIWGHYVAYDMNLLSNGDLDEALKAAMAIGDDTLQKNAGQRVRPESFTHGSSRQRMQWFKRGFDSGDMRACDTFK
jgi:predicted metalloprotease